MQQINPSEPLVLQDGPYHVAAYFRLDEYGIAVSVTNTLGLSEFGWLPSSGRTQRDTRIPMDASIRNYLEEQGFTRQVARWAAEQIRERVEAIQTDLNASQKR